MMDHARQEQRVSQRIRNFAKSLQKLITATRVMLHRTLLDLNDFEKTSPEFFVVDLAQNPPEEVPIFGVKLEKT